MAVRRSLVFAFIDRYTGLASGIVSSMILARLLSPAEIGVFSIVMVMLGMVSTLRDMGAGQYLLQEKELTADRIRAVWTVQLSLGALLSVTVAAAGPLMASFYDDPRMVPVMLVLALNYLINPIGSITYAWLVRDMRFDALAVIRFASTVCAAVLSILLAWLGHGPVSLAWGSVVGTAAGAIASAAYRPAGFPWLPGTTEVKRVLSFGSKLSLTSIINSATTGFPEFYLGKAFGMAAAGYYSRANGLMMMFHRLVSDGVGNVALAMFSQKSRENETLVAPFLKAFAYITAVGVAFCLSLALLAEPAILFLYGEQWLEAVPLTRVLAISVMLGIPVKICSSAILATGAVGRTLTIAAINLIASISVGLLAGPFGLTWFAAASVVSAGISLALWLRISRAIVGFRWRDLAKVAFSSCAVGTLASVGPACLFMVDAPKLISNAGTLALGGLIGSIGFVAAVFILKHELTGELTLLSQRLFRRRK